MMNLKYYLRGLGIGVVVTALIMGITAGKAKETLSNEEIKERARALGMVEESRVLTDVIDNDSSQKEEKEPSPSSEDALSSSVADVSSEVEPEPMSEGSSDSDSEDSDDGQEDMGNAERQETTAADSEPENQGEVPEESDNGDESSSGESVTIEVNSGEGSFVVCQKLEDAGLVSLASEFDRYLYENGYDKRINVGTYEIPVGAEWEEIARIIAKLN